MKNKAKKNICVITPLLGKAGITPLSNLVRLLEACSDKIIVLSGGFVRELRCGKNTEVVDVSFKIKTNIFSRLCSFLFVQIRILAYILLLRNKVDFFTFTLGGESLFPSIFCLKLLRKKVIIIPGGVTTKVYSIKGEYISTIVSSLLIHFSLILADKLILYSRGLVREGRFEKFASKTIIAHRHFVDFKIFKINKRLSDRSNLIGYVGRLSAEKGVVPFLNAASILLETRDDYNFEIYGDGELRMLLDDTILSKKLQSRVKIKGWIPHHELPKILNELKLLIIPSYTEGLPNILLEAMACGTPVLATPVGAIPDIIENKQNGFLLASNDPEHIAKKILELISNQSLLQKVTSAAYLNVREAFNEKIVLESYCNIISGLLDR